MGSKSQDGDEISDGSSEGTIPECAKYLHRRALPVDEGGKFKAKVGLAGKLYAKLCT